MHVAQYLNIYITYGQINISCESVYIKVFGMKAILVFEHDTRRHGCTSLVGESLIPLGATNMPPSNHRDIITMVLCVHNNQ